MLLKIKFTQVCGDSIMSSSSHCQTGTNTHKQLGNKLAELRILDSMSKWSRGDVTFAIFVFCLICHIRRFLKKLRSLRATKEKAVKAVDVYIWISSFLVTCQSLHRRLRSEASVGEVCFDVVLASYCKGKRIPQTYNIHRALVSSAKDKFWG